MSRVRFIDSPCYDDPPPWEPQFEDVSPLESPHRRPLDPPPPCFSTLSPLRIRSHDFPPFRIPAVSDNLTDGFRPLYPCKVLDRHGLTREDWIRFLQDLRIAARLSDEATSPVGSRVPLSGPLLTHRILFPWRAVGAVYDARFARSPVAEVRALIEIWNQCAFERRKIRVTLQVWQVGPTGRRNHYALLVESL